MSNAVYVYVQDTMADWEPSFVLAELNSGRFFKEGATRYHVETVSPTSDPIITMGGLRILPDRVVGEITPSGNDLLLLPGGETLSNNPSVVAEH